MQAESKQKANTTQDKCKQKANKMQMQCKVNANRPQLKRKKDANKTQMFCFSQFNTGRRPTISQRMVLTIREM